MNEYAQHIIARLKRYNRCSTPWTTGSESEENIKNQKEAIANIKDETSALIDIYKDLGSTVVKLAETEAARTTGIGKLIKVQQDLAKNMQDLSSDANILAKRNANLQKSFGLSVVSAAQLGYQFDKMAGELGTSRENIEKNYTAISKLTGGFGQNVKGLIKLNQYYTVNRGLTQEMADGLLTFASNQAKVDENGKISEESLENQSVLLRNQFAAIEKITGIKGAQLTVEQEIGKASSATRLTFGKYPAQLGMAVMKAKALGLELSDLEAVGDNLLSIESSVGEELNYQLLTGHRLVDNNQKSLTNKYRELYLAGKSEEAAQTMYEIFDKEGDTLENNMLARKQMAKVLGIEEDKVASIVEKRKLMKNLIDKSTGKPLSVDIFSKTGKELQDYLAKNTDATTESIEKIMQKDDIRDPATQTADTLKSIEANGIRLRMGTEDGAVKLITDAQAGTDAMITKFGNTMAGKFDGIVDMLETRLGQQQIEREARSTEEGGIAKNLTKLLEGLGGTSAIVADAAKQMVEAIPAAVKTFVQGTKIETMTVGTITEGVNDGVMINDGIRFNPRDKFRRVNDGMTVAGTNVGGLDRYAAQMEKRDRNFEQNMSRMISNMASTITQAIERANLKINIDRTFGGTSMNPRGKYGAM